MGYRLKPKKTYDKPKEAERTEIRLHDKERVDHLEDGYNVAPLCHTLTIAKFFI